MSADMHLDELRGRQPCRCDHRWLASDFFSIFVAAPLVLSNRDHTATYDEGAAAALPSTAAFEKVNLESANATSTIGLTSASHARAIGSRRSISVRASASPP
jgi:hypothetical protein